MGVTTGPSLDFSVWTAHWSWGIRKSIDLKRYCWPQNVILVHPLTISLQLRQKWSVFKRHNQCLPRQGKAGRPHSASLSSCTQSGSPWTMWKMAIRSRENILLSSPIKKSTKLCNTQWCWRTGSMLDPGILWQPPPTILIHPLKRKVMACPLTLPQQWTISRLPLCAACCLLWTF